MKIILASSSPRRKELMTKMLEKYNKDYIIEPSNYDEEKLKSKITDPSELVTRLAYEKANDIFLRHDENNFMVIGSDLIVHFEGEHLGKPKSKEDAFHMLKKIQNNCNVVYTGMVIIMKKDGVITNLKAVSISKVYMLPMTDNDINWYIETEEPLDKAGSYAIQGIGNKFIEKFEGSFESIVGLDINKLEEMIKEELI